MRPKSFALLALALACGAVASIGISQVMDKNKLDASANNVETEPIYVAKVAINLGDPVKAEMVNLEEWPKDKIPAGAIRELEEIEGRRPVSTIFPGEPILDGKLVLAGVEMDATGAIPKGFRILPISVNAETGMAGLINPGDRVDVQWFVTRNPSLKIEKTMTKTILHNVRVFAIDQKVRRMREGDDPAVLAKTITLVVTPKQANMIRLADKIGEISLIARNPDDPDSKNSATVDFDALVSTDEKKSRKKERETSAVESNDGTSKENLLSSFINGFKASVAAKATQTQVVPKVEKPFRMEIIAKDEVKVQLFSSKDGLPMDEEEGTGNQYDYSDSSNASVSNGQQAKGFDLSEASSDPSSVDESENDFPIDMEENEK